MRHAAAGSPPLTGAAGSGAWQVIGGRLWIATWPLEGLNGCAKQGSPWLLPWLWPGVETSKVQRVSGNWTVPPAKPAGMLMISAVQRFTGLMPSKEDAFGGAKGNWVTGGGA